MQVKLISVIANVIIQNSVDETRRSGMFSICANETNDMSKQEEMSIVLRYVFKNQVFESFIRYTTYAKKLNA